MLKKIDSVIESTHIKYFKLRWLHVFLNQPAICTVKLGDAGFKSHLILGMSLKPLNQLFKSFYLF